MVTNLEDYGEQTKTLLYLRYMFGKYCTYPILVNIVTVLSMGLGRSEIIGANRIMIRMPFNHISLIGVWAQSF